MILRTSFAAAVLAIDSICCLSYHSWRREMSVDRLAEVDAPSKANSEAGHSWSTDGITNAYDSAAYTACFIIWQSTLNTHLFSCAPVLVSPGSEWWRSAEFLEEKEKKTGKCVTVHAFLSLTGWLLCQYGEWKAGKLLEHLRLRS